MADTNNTIRQLSLAQSKAYAGFAAGLSLSEISRQAGISRQTLHTWLKSDHTFIQAAAVARQEYIEAFSDRLCTLTRKALDRLEAILDDPKAPASVALKAALAVINRPQSGWNLPNSSAPKPDFQNPSPPETNHIELTPLPQPDPDPPLAAEIGQNLTPSEEMAVEPSAETRKIPNAQNSTPARDLDALDHLFLKTLIAASSKYPKTPLPQR